MLHRCAVLSPDADYPLHITAKQYWLREFEAFWDDRDALTLVMLHSTSFHKETWEPTIRYILDDLVKHLPPLAQQRTRNVIKVKCVWAIECPNHGESAALNSVALQQPPYFRGFGCERYAEAVHRFMSLGHVLSPPVNFWDEALVGIGHSLGGVAIAILQVLQPVFPFVAVILVEPLLSPQGPPPLHPLKMRLVKSAQQRCDEWPTRADASAYFSSRKHSARWHPDVLDLYVKFGLTAHPGAWRGIATHGGVTLACSREEEAAMYRDSTGVVRGMEALNRTCILVPISIVFGSEDDYVPRFVQDAVVDPASGRRFQRIYRIEGAGHLVPQQTPQRLGQVLVDVLATCSVHPTGKL